ncbi:MAG: hypothetical protein ABSA30_13090 [Candidatus Aminicenantales bacterium]
MKKAAIGLMALILAGVVAFAAASVTGTWEMSYTTARGERKMDVTFTQTGENIDFKITRTTPQGERTTEYKGKLVDDNNMAGTFEMNMGGNAQTIDWKAVRKPK